MIIDVLEVIFQARLQEFSRRMDAGNTGGKLLIYTASKPTPGNGITTQILLATVDFPKPAGTVAGNEFTFAVPGDVVITASGLAAWGRFTDSEGFWVADASVGLIGSGAYIQTDRLDWIQGSIVRLTLSTLSESV